VFEECVAIKFKKSIVSTTTSLSQKKVTFILCFQHDVHKKFALLRIATNCSQIHSAENCYEPEKFYYSSTTSLLSSEFHD